jgi:hypothetical protein
MRFMTNPNRSLACLVVLGSLAIGACSKAGLEPLPLDELGKYDNKLAVEGQYCTQSDRPTPFPVKILIVLDRSGSWQFTDPNNAHFQAITEVVDRNIGLPNVSIGIVAFNAGIDVTPFTTDRQVVTDALAAAFASGQTDYQGALTTAVRLLEQDMLDASIATRARTKYVVMFVSDGEPDPRCNAGCGNDPSCWGYCDTDPDVDPDDDLRPEDYEGLFIDLVACGDYNADWQITQKIDQMIALRDNYGVGELRLHTMFVYGLPEPVIPPLCDGVPPTTAPRPSPGCSSWRSTATARCATTTRGKVSTSSTSTTARSGGRGPCPTSSSTTRRSSPRTRAKGSCPTAIATASATTRSSIRALTG